MTVYIYRAWPVINGYVQVPNNLQRDKTRVTVDEALDAIAGSNVESLSLGSGPSTGSKHGAQEIFKLPPVASDGWYAANPVDQVD